MISYFQITNLFKVPPPQILESVLINQVILIPIAKYVYIQEVYEWCSRVLDIGWKSRFPFRAKVFLWRVMISGLPLAIALKRRHISSGTRVLCTTID